MPSSWSYEKQLNKNCSPRFECLCWKWAPVDSPPSSLPLSEAQGYLEQQSAGWWLTTGSLQHRRKGSWPKAQNSCSWAATPAATKDQSCENYSEFSPFSPNNTSYFDLKSRQLLGTALKIHPLIPGHCEEAHWELWYLSIYLSLPPGCCQFCFRLKSKGAVTPKSESIYYKEKCAVYMHIHTYMHFLFWFIKGNTVAELLGKQMLSIHTG